MANLYELMGRYKAVQEAIDAEVMTDAQIERTLETLDEMKGPLREKVDNICRLLANLASDAEGYKSEEERLAKRRKALEGRHKRLREWIRNSMNVLDVPEIKAGLHTVQLGEATKKVEVRDEKLVPERYTSTKTSVVKSLVMQAYKDDGEVVEGCEIVDGDRKLTIR